MKGNVLDMLSEVGEFTLDYFLKEGVLKDFPLVGSVLKMLQAGNDISKEGANKRGNISVNLYLT